MAFAPDAAFSYLRRAHAQNRLAHAYLISGTPGSGKRELASRLANLVNGTTSENIFATGTPDVYVAEPGSKSRRIVIDQIRNLEHALQMRATAGRRKVAIVSDADRLQPQAANAFLKTLEEPPNDSLLLLLTTMPEALMDTIISRCVPLPLAAPPQRPPSAEELEVLALL
ncbi:MAG TPA: AAA family ATPase, partial [Chthoniobacterales bacterium]